MVGWHNRLSGHEFEKTHGIVKTGKTGVHGVIELDMT